jgi:hypothetical protein
MSWCRAPLWGPWPDFTFPFFCRTVALLFVLRRHLWREDGAVICTAICQWSESRRTQPYITVPSETTGFPFRSLLRLAGITVKVFYPLWREDWSVTYTAICRWSESQRTHNHTLLSHLGTNSVPIPSPLTTRGDYGGSILTSYGLHFKGDGEVSSNKPYQLQFLFGKLQ